MSQARGKLTKVSKVMPSPPSSQAKHIEAITKHRRHSSRPIPALRYERDTTQLLPTPPASSPTTNRTRYTIAPEVRSVDQNVRLPTPPTSQKSQPHRFRHARRYPQGTVVPSSEDEEAEVASFSTTDDPAGAGNETEGKITVRTREEAAALAAVWQEISEAERQRFVKNEMLRTAIWPHHERLTSGQLRQEFDKENSRALGVLYPYAFDSSGDPYSEYLRKWGAKSDLRHRFVREQYSCSPERDTPGRPVEVQHYGSSVILPRYRGCNTNLQDQRVPWGNGQAQPAAAATATRSVKAEPSASSAEDPSSSLAHRKRKYRAEEDARKRMKVQSPEPELPTATSSSSSSLPIDHLPAASRCRCVDLHPDLASGRVRYPLFDSRLGLGPMAFGNNLRQIAQCRHHPRDQRVWCKGMMQENRWHVGNDV